MDKKKSNSNVVKFNRWGYIFLIPFFVTYIVFSLIWQNKTILPTPHPTSHHWQNELPILFFPLNMRLSWTQSTKITAEFEYIFLM